MQHDLRIAVVSAAQTANPPDYSDVGGAVIWVPQTPTRAPSAPKTGSWSRIGDLYDLQLKDPSGRVDSKTEPQPKER
jgi:hypothetical protein